jgi:hypothetical protein
VRQEEKEPDPGDTLGGDNSNPPFIAFTPSSSAQEANSVVGDIDMGQFRRWVKGCGGCVTDVFFLLCVLVLHDLRELLGDTLCWFISFVSHHEKGSRDLSYLLCFQYSLRPFLSHIIIIPVSAVLFVSFIALFSSSFHFSKKYLSQLSFLSYLILRISFFAYCYSSFLFFLLGASKSIALYCIPYLTLPLISLQLSHANLTRTFILLCILPRQHLLYSPFYYPSSPSSFLISTCNRLHAENVRKILKRQEAILAEAESERLKKIELTEQTAVLKIAAENMFWSLSPLPPDISTMVRFSYFSHSALSFFSLFSCIFYYLINIFPLSSTLLISPYSIILRFKTFQLRII